MSSDVNRRKAPGFRFTARTRSRLAVLLILSFFWIPVNADEHDSGSGSAAGVAVGESEAIINEPDITRRVIGGRSSQPGNWPSVVMLAVEGRFPLQERLFCGGTVIADRYVMTAAHCLFDDSDRVDLPSEIVVVENVHDMAAEEEFAQEHIVTHIVIHPDYDNTLRSPPNDIALLELANVLQSPPVKLFVKDTEDYTDTLGYIVGWGATRYFNEQAAQYPTVQQQAAVPLVSLANCNSLVSYNGSVGVTQVCAGYPMGGVDTCTGDSGGPLYLEEDGEIVQVGITSFGIGCADENYYGIYTNISHFIPWLSNYIDVPEQSADLIAAREAAAIEASNGGTGSGVNNGGTRSGAGAALPVSICLLAMAWLLRHACSGSGHGRKQADSRGTPAHSE